MNRSSTLYRINSFSPLHQQDFHDIGVYTYELQPVTCIASGLFFSEGNQQAAGFIPND
jgi:hypothetical protein